MHELIDRLSAEVFHVLFSNRKFLSQFNLFMARALQNHFNEMPESELGRNLRSPGRFEAGGFACLG
jgi:hypothetical protein